MLPVVSYATGSVSEVVSNGLTGRFVPLGDTEHLARAIIEPIENPYLAYEMEFAGRERIRKMFSWERRLKSLLRRLKQ